MTNLWWTTFTRADCDSNFQWACIANRIEIDPFGRRQLSHDQVGAVTLWAIPQGCSDRDGYDIPNYWLAL
jgi:hypothetical protein